MTPVVLTTRWHLGWRARCTLTDGRLDWNTCEVQHEDEGVWEEWEPGVDDDLTGYATYVAAAAMQTDLERQAREHNDAVRASGGELDWS